MCSELHDICYILFVLYITYYTYILYMIHLKVNFNSAFIFIYIFFNLHIFKSVLEKNDDGLHIKDERHMK